MDRLCEPFFDSSRRAHLQADKPRSPLRRELGPTDIALALLVGLLLAGPSARELGSLLIPVRLGGMSGAGLLSYLLLGVLALLAAPGIIARIQLYAFVVPVVVTIPLLASMLLYQSESEFFDMLAITVLLYALPWYFVGFAIRDHTVLLRILYPTALVIIVAQTGLLAMGGIGADATYSQFAGYQVLPATVILFDRVVRRPRIQESILCLWALGLLIATGARGPLFALGGFALCRLILAIHTSSRAKRVLVALGIPMALLVSAVLPSALLELRALLTRTGLSTRALDRFVEGRFLEDRAREQLVDLSFGLVSEHAVFGVGPGADRIYLARAMGNNSPDELQGWYPHNILLELVVQYGLIIGLFLAALLAYTILRVFLVNPDPIKKRLALICVGLGTFPLLVSGSYLTSDRFFLAIGLCVFLCGRKVLRPSPSPGPLSWNRYPAPIESDDGNDMNEGRSGQ